MPLIEEDTTQSHFIECTVNKIKSVFETISTDIGESADHEVVSTIRDQFSPGKMLRTQLGFALFQEKNTEFNSMISTCAATELIHSATLFHDDVIDCANLRRGQPSLWREIGAAGAVLLGDLFFSSSIQMLIEGGELNKVSSFVNKVREVCAKEVVHELVYHGREIDSESCIRIARGKTGPLFAFVSEACGGKDTKKSSALAEVGYRLGTAYQLADDLMDVVGEEDVIGKTLGTDMKRRKFTLAQGKDFSEAFILKQINELCISSLELLWEWPEYLPKLELYIVKELLPFLKLDLNN